MITLTNGHIQGPNNIPVPKGTVELILSQDAQVIAPPFGQVMSGIPIVFGFDSVGDILAGSQIWSNAEITPSGTAYLVNFYDANGARVNANPFIWVFGQASGSSVDIGTIQTTSNTISYPLAGGPLLKTNGVTNTTQNIFNAVNGTNMSISSDAAGNVTFNNTAGGDGIIHGDTIWEIDPAFVLIRDDFNGGNATSGGIGELGWSLNTSGSPSLSCARGVPGGLPGAGAFVIGNSGITNNFANLSLTPAVVGSGFGDFFLPLFDYPVGWKAVFVFALGTDSNLLSMSTNPQTKKSLYVGLGATYNPFTGTGFPPRPNIFFGLRYDTDATSPAIGDTTFNFEVVNNLTNSTTNSTRNNTQGTVVNTGVVPTTGVVYRLEIQMIAAGVITMSLNGSAPQAFNISTMVAGGSGAAGQAGIQNGYARVTPTPTSGQNDVTIFSAGSKVTVAGLSGVFTGLNGAQTVLNAMLNGPNINFATAVGNQNNASVNNISVTGYPAVVPLFSYGNDSHSSPDNNVMNLAADFFALIWNPKVGGGTGTPLSTKPRYF